MCPINVLAVGLPALPGCSVVVPDLRLAIRKDKSGRFMNWTVGGETDLGRGWYPENGTATDLRPEVAAMREARMISLFTLLVRLPARAPALDCVLMSWRLRVERG
jgi:hypothetical protein